MPSSFGIIEHIIKVASPKYKETRITSPILFSTLKKSFVANEPDISGTIIVDIALIITDGNSMMLTAIPENSPMRDKAVS